MVVLVIICLALLTYLHCRRKRRCLPLPPGPPADPFIGHLRVLPRQNPQDTYYAWGKQYGPLLTYLDLRSPLIELTGDVISLRLLGKTIVVLNSENAAKELLDRRGANYSERPSFALLHAYVSRTSLAVPQSRLNIFQSGLGRRSHVLVVQQRRIHEEAQFLSATVRSP